MTTPHKGIETEGQEEKKETVVLTDGGWHTLLVNTLLDPSQALVLGGPELSLLDSQEPLCWDMLIVWGCPQTGPPQHLPGTSPLCHSGAMLGEACISELCSDRWVPRTHPLLSYWPWNYGLDSHHMCSTWNLRQRLESVPGDPDCVHVLITPLEFSLPADWLNFHLI